MTYCRIPAHHSVLVPEASIGVWKWYSRFPVHSASIGCWRQCKFKSHIRILRCNIKARNIIRDWISIYSWSTQQSTENHCHSPGCCWHGNSHCRVRTALKSGILQKIRLAARLVQRGQDCQQGCGKEHFLLQFLLINFFESYVEL